MASNLDYLNPALLPLEQTVLAYLEAEEELRKADVDRHSRQAEHEAAPTATGHAFAQRPATGSFDQTGEELSNKMRNLQENLSQLREQILQQLPARDEWVKVNLGYGPSRVGAFRDESVPGEERYLIRVVH